MKRRLLITMIAVALAFSLTGCGSKKEEQTTATTEAASEVKDEFIQFVGTDIPKVEKDEADVMNKYNAYFAEGTSVDTGALLKDLSENLLPKYKTFLDSVESIEVKTDEVMALKDQYYDAMNTQYEALQQVETAVKDKNKDLRTKRLGDILIHSEIKSLKLITFICLRCQHDNRNLRIFSDLLECLPSIHLRHHNIQYYKRDILVIHKYINSLLTVSGFKNNVTISGQEILNKFSHPALIINH